MSREWKPGDVALIEAGCHANRQVAIRAGVPSNMGWAYSDTHDGKSTGTWTADAHGTVSVVRPLVVIDPEDREQVERLALLVRDNPASDWVDSTQAALREFANPTPPKPEEPTGLGAVVEDAEGEQWVRFARVALGNMHWRNEKDPANPRCARWSHITAARVLSEGVTA